MREYQYLETDLNRRRVFTGRQEKDLNRQLFWQLDPFNRRALVFHVGGLPRHPAGLRRVCFYNVLLVDKYILPSLNYSDFSFISSSKYQSNVFHPPLFGSSWLSKISNGLNHRPPFATSSITLLSNTTTLTILPPHHHHYNHLHTRFSNRYNYHRHTTYQLSSSSPSPLPLPLHFHISTTTTKNSWYPLIKLKENNKN